jgi:hypothetical protein
MFAKLAGFTALAFLIGCSGKGQPDTVAAADAPAPSAALLPGPKPAAVTIPAGTRVRVRLAETLNTERNNAGDKFSATLDSPLTVGENTIVPKGATFHGHVTTADSSGRLKGRAVMAVTLDSFEHNGKSYTVATSAQSRVSSGHKKRNTALIGGGAGLGAVLGAVAGGGKGAVIGAGAGAAAGTAGAAATGKQTVSFPVETLLTFSLKTPVRI